MNGSRYINIDWYAETYFYILEINGNIKFGITSNWQRRVKEYQKEIGELSCRVLKKELYDKRWKAELLEQIIKWRLKPWCAYNRHEWIFNTPIQLVFDCYLETRAIIVPEIQKYEYIHRIGNNRWGYYKQIFDMTFDEK